MLVAHWGWMWCQSFEDNFIISDSLVVIMLLTVYLWWQVWWWRWHWVQYLTAEVSLAVLSDSMLMAPSSSPSKPCQHTHKEQLIKITSDNLLASPRQPHLFSNLFTDGFEDLGHVLKNSDISLCLWTADWFCKLVWPKTGFKDLRTFPTELGQDTQIKKEPETCVEHFAMRIVNLIQAS